MDWASFTIGAWIACMLAFALGAVGLYCVIRRRFLLWLSARLLAIGVLALSFPPMADFLFSDAQTLLVVRLIATDISIALAGPVMATYLERSLGLDRLRKLFWAVVPVGIGLALCAPLIARDILPLWLHSAVVLVMVAMMTVGLVSAIRAGSRPARFQSVAWGPAILLGFVAIYCELLLGEPFRFYTEAMLAALMVEVIVTPIGIGDGFRIVQRERDRALAEMREATEASTLDPLTGIANRRGLHRRFLAGPARPDGIAVVDCDLFKQINDAFGHDVGDEVLVAVGAALGAGENIFPARVGGEEFVLLLYGEDWQRAAEAARRNISAVVAQRVPQLPTAVTASAGLSSVQADDSLDTAIKRADRALYAAKDAGRDRSISLTDFHRRFTRLEEVG
ncbi:MAG: GGDEF domain-containing protein [Erythrobacter sp.]|nr:GGDEF domain-containing protein [Erythrobacter sp.]